MIKKVVVLAAGRGTRMKELGEHTPKPLIPVLGKPFLHFLLTNLTKAGFEEVIMVTGHLSDQVEQFMQESKELFPKFQTINQFEIMGEDKYGTLVPLLAAKEVLNGDPFVVVNGDNLFSLQDLQKMGQGANGYHLVAGIRKENPVQYGTLVPQEDHMLLRIDEKVPEPESNIINAGAYTFLPEVFEVVGNVQPNTTNGEYYITEALTQLTDRSGVKIMELEDYWLDFGKPEDIPVVESFIRDNDLYDLYGVERT
ncbi:MAG: nucleotidyltransferase family protein [Patescibacteria group bacterium]